MHLDRQVYAIRTPRGAGILDTLGAFVVKPRYDSVHIFGYRKQDIAFVRRKGMWRLFDLNTRQFYPEKITHFAYTHDMPSGLVTRNYYKVMLEHEVNYGDHYPRIVYWTRKGDVFVILEESMKRLSLSAYRQLFSKTGPLPDVLEQFIKNRGNW